METKQNVNKCPVCTPACVRWPKCDEPETVQEAAFREVERLFEMARAMESLVDSTRVMVGGQAVRES